MGSLTTNDSLIQLGLVAIQSSISCVALKMAQASVAVGQFIVYKFAGMQYLPLSTLSCILCLYQSIRPCECVLPEMAEQSPPSNGRRP
jgi:hypothetical protein